MHIATDERMFEIDENVRSAIKNYFLYNLPPGSFTSWALYGDMVEARAHAHPNIKEYMDDYKLYISFLPDECKGENMKSWPGYENCKKQEQEEIKFLLKLKYTDRNYVLLWIKEFERKEVLRKSIYQVNKKPR